MPNKKYVEERARALVNTSVEDLQSGLWFYQWNMKLHVQIVRRGLKICEERKEKTKVMILRRKLKGMEKCIEVYEASMEKEAEDASVSIS